MKLRLQRNSVRLRLTRSEVERLARDGAVEESVDFGGASLTYRLRTAPQTDSVKVRFSDGAVTVSLSEQTAKAWAAPTRSGFTRG